MSSPFVSPQDAAVVIPYQKIKEEKDAMVGWPVTNAE
jgi:hypothetical protein